MKSFFFTMLLLGTIILSTSVYITSVLIGRSQNAIETTGTVINFEYKTGGNGKQSRIPVIKYKDINSNEVTFTSTAVSKFSKINDTVTVKYQPSHPEDAYVPNYTIWIILFLMGYLIGGIFFLFGFIPPIVIGYRRLKKRLTK